MSAYTQMGVKAYQSEHGAKQHRLHSRHPAFDHVHKPKHPSNVLFSWLFKACVVFQLYKWLQVNTFAHAMALWLAWNFQFSTQTLYTIYALETI